MLSFWATGVSLVANAVTFFPFAHESTLVKVSPRVYTPAEVVRAARDKPADTVDAPAVVRFDFAPQPTADPKVFDYHPGYPVNFFAPSLRVVFDSPPGRLPDPGFKVRGHVAGFKSDGRSRPTRAPGVLVLDRVRLLSQPPSPPPPDVRAAVGVAGVPAK